MRPFSPVTVRRFNRARSASLGRGFASFRSDHHNEDAVMAILHKSTPQFRKGIALAIFGLGVALIVAWRLKS